MAVPRMEDPMFKCTLQPRTFKTSVLVTSWVKIMSKSRCRIKSANIPTLVRAVMPLMYNVAILMVLIGTVGGMGGGVVVLG